MSSLTITQLSPAPNAVVVQGVITNNTVVINPLSVTNYLEAIPGPVGAEGPQGVQGPIGNTGPAGPTYTVSCVDGDNLDEEKIRLTASTGDTDDVVLEAGTGLSIARNSDKITLTLDTSSGLNVTGDIVVSGTVDGVNVATDVAANTAKVSADGLVTTHNDVSDAGSGAIITDLERTKLNGVEAAATADQTGAEIKTSYEAETKAFTDAQFDKLAGVADNATANQTDAHLLARVNHTGTQLASTISDFDSAVAANTDVAANTAKTGISSGQASEITANTAKVTFPGFGTTSGTALEGDTSLFSGAYADLTGKPSLFDGSYASLTSVPSTFNPAAHSHAISEITSLQTTLNGLIPYSGASSNVNLNSKTLTGVSSITSSSALFGASPASLRAFNIKGTGLDGRLSLQGGSGDFPGLEMTTNGNASRVLLRMAEIGTDGTSLQIFTEPEGGGIAKHLEVDDDGTLYVFPSGTAAATAGDAGFKNNSGTMQFKNSSGSWTDIPSSGGSTNELDGQSIEIITRSSAYANNTWEGEVVKFGSDTLVQNKFYVHTSSGWVTADADVEANTKGLFGIALGTSSATDGLLVKGIHSSNAHAFSAGDTLYVGTTEGTVTTTVPSTPGEYVRVVGYVLSSSYIYINPSPDYIEIA